MVALFGFDSGVTILILIPVGFVRLCMIETVNVSVKFALPWLLMCSRPISTTVEAVC